MRILVTGGAGQLGWELRRTLAIFGEVVAPPRDILDLASVDSIVAAVRGVRPGLIVNAAAYTAVDKAESDPELAMKINGDAPRILARLQDDRVAAQLPGTDLERAARAHGRIEEHQRNGTTGHLSTQSLGLELCGSLQ